jgi:predicted nucleotidyltransferase
MTRWALARSLREFFQADAHGAAAVYLFGSAARGTARPDSDVDVGLLLASPPPPTLDDHPSTWRMRSSARLDDVSMSCS